MSINLSNLIWIIFVILSILMGISIGRSYMWLVAGSIILFLLIYNRGRGISKNKLVRRYCYFIVYCTLITILSLFNSGYKLNVYIKSQLVEMLILSFLASYMAVYYAKVSSMIEFIKKASWLLLVAGVIEEITRFNITKYLGNSKNVTSYLINEGRIISIFGHPIGYALVITLFFLLALYYPYESRNKQVTYMIFILINLLCTKSRMAMIAVMISAIIYFVKNGTLKRFCEGRFTYNKNVFIYFMIIVLVGVVAIYIFHNRILDFWGSIVYRIAQIFTMSEQGIRLGVLTNYLNNLKEISGFEILFGKGAGYSSLYMIENPIFFWNSAGDKVAWAETTDNMYISVLMDYGVVGCLLLLTVLMTAIKTLFSETETNVIFGCSGIIALFFDLFFFEGLYWPIIMNIMGIYMALITKRACYPGLEMGNGW